MTAFLPPISATTRLRWRWPSGTSAAVRTISSPTLFEPVKAIVWTRGSLTSAAPTSPSPGSSASASGGTPASRSACTSSAAQPGVCSAGLSSTALPVARPGRDHPERDRDGEVPGRDHRDDAARASSAARCARPAPAAAARPGRGRARRARSTRGSRSPRRRRRRPRATAWPPRGPRAPRSRAAARAATPPRRRGSRRAARGFVAPHVRAPRPAASASAASTSSGVAAAASATTRSGVPGSVETRSSPSRRSPPIHTGTLTGGSRVVRGERAGELRADRRPPQLEDRLVGERLHARRRRREQLLERHAAGLVVEERVVARVLQQPAHEVGHAGHEVADRAVGAHAQALGGDRLLQRVAEAAQDLQLDVGVVAAREAVVGDRVGDRAQVVRRDRRAQPAAVGVVVDQPRVSCSKLTSDSALTSNTGGFQPCCAASTISWSQ